VRVGFGDQRGCTVARRARLASLRWVGNLADLASPHLLIPVALANAVVIIASYFGGAAFIWGIADAKMAQSPGRTMLFPFQ
jgi:hypothetical protein